MVVSKKPATYGNCEMKIDFKGRVAEPPNHVKGNVARTYFYMEQKYGLKIASQQRKLFEVWSKQDPPDDEEIKLANRIAKVMGHRNSFIPEQ